MVEFVTKFFKDCLRLYFCSQMSLGFQWGQCRFPTAPIAVSICILLCCHGFGTTAAMTNNRRLELKQQTKEMFHHGWTSYMTYAYPKDELNPFNCTGRGSDRYDPNNININDVLGDYGVTLVDTLDTLAIMGEQREFENAVKLVTRHVSFNQDSKVQVFETNIRSLGGLLSAHILASDSQYGYTIEGYNGELLRAAKDLAQRLVPAFQMSRTGIPYPRVNLRYGVPKTETVETCTAGAGSLILEFGVLSRLTNDPFYENLAKKALKALWERRSDLNLMGNAINLQTGQWVYAASSVGAGIDSFFEYLLKAHILFGDDEYYDMFEDAYSAIMTYVADPSGYYYKNVDMSSGQLMSHWIDSLSAFWPGLQVLYGDLEMAIKSHLTYYNVWKKYRGMPERYNYVQNDIDIGFYPIRPEFAESTYFLYRATRDPFYLEVGEMIMKDIDDRARLPCGFASLADVRTGALEDRMESFVLSETFKYLYLLFDVDHPLNHEDSNFVFTTEGHVMPMPVKHDTKLQRPPKSWGKIRTTCQSYPALQNDWISGSPHGNNHSLSFTMLHQPVADYAQYLIRRNTFSEPVALTKNGYCEVPKTATDKFKLKFGAVKDEDYSITPRILKLIDGLFSSTLAGLDVEFTKVLRGSEGYDVTKVGKWDTLSTGQVFQVPFSAIEPYFSSELLALEFHFPTGVMFTSRNYTPQEVVTIHIGSFDGISQQTIIGAGAAFGPDLSDMDEMETSLVIFDPQLDTFIGCSQYSDDEKRAIKGNMIIVGRGNCNFEDKVILAQSAGAAGVIFVNVEENKVFQVVGSTTPKRQIHIPSMMISSKDALQLLGNNFDHRFPLHIPGAKLKDLRHSYLSYDTKLTVNGKTVHNLVFV